MLDSNIKQLSDLNPSSGVQNQKESESANFKLHFDQISFNASLPDNSIVVNLVNGEILCNQHGPNMYSKKSAKLTTAQF